MNVIIYLISITLTICLVVGVHEFGHFIAARLLGVKVLRFSIGFGKALYHWYDKRGTEYVIAPIPLGGYVKLLDESEGPVKKDELHLAYNQQPIYKRFLIVIAGPISNLLFALLIYWLLFMIGFNSIAPIVGKVIPGSIAAQAGMKPNTEITAVNQESTSGWTSVIIHILTQAGNKSIMRLTGTTNGTSNIYSLDLSTWHLNDLKPDPLTSLGIVPFEPDIPTVIGKMAVDSPASHSGLKVGDKITAMNHQPVKNWEDVLKIITENPNKNIPVIIIRNKQTSNLTIHIGYKNNGWFNQTGYLGISPKIEWPKNFIHNNQYPPLAALKHAWNDANNFIELNFIILGKMLTGKISVRSLGGPISIFEIAGQSLNNGFIPYLTFLAFLSISIGVINILPVPGLDGGHLLFQAIELVSRRPVSLRLQLLLYRLGFIFLLLLIMQTLFNDILRLK